MGHYDELRPDSHYKDIPTVEKNKECVDMLTIAIKSQQMIIEKQQETITSLCEKVVEMDKDIAELRHTQEFIFDRID